MSQIEFNDPRFWLDVIQMVAIVALWLRKPGEDAGRALERLTNRVDVLDERLKHMPSSEELAELEGNVLAIKATLQGMQETQQTTRATVTRIEQYLLHSKGGGV